MVEGKLLLEAACPGCGDDHAYVGATSVELLKSLIVEITRHKREGVSLPSKFELLRRYVGVGYMNFSNVNRLGFRPSSSFGTPQGIYAYPITDAILSEFEKTGRLPFASNRKFIHVMVPRNPERIITLQDLSDENVVALAKEAYHILGYDEKISKRKLLQLMKNSKQKTLAGKFWSLMLMLSTHRPSDEPSVSNRTDAFSFNVLCRRMNIDGVVDLGGAILQSQIEPTMAVFFSSQAVEHVATIDNPYKVKVSTSNFVSDDINLSSFSFMNETELPDKEALRVMRSCLSSGIIPPYESCITYVLSDPMYMGEPILYARIEGQDKAMWSIGLEKSLSDIKKGSWIPA